MSDERRETIDASHVSRLTSPRVSCLASRAFVGPNWPTHPFEHLFSEPSRNGFYSPNPTGPISAKIIGMGTLFHSDLVRAVDSQETNISPTEFDRFSVRSGDLLFGRRSLVESGAGKVSLVCSLSESAIFESSLIRVRLNENLALPQFYLYFFKSRHGRSIVSSIVTGTNVKGIRSSELSKILVPLPPLSEQRRIVGILSAYDDLIENNRKRIALLEESARRLYKEWFVRLRFPGHERVPVEDGVPKGWSWAPLSEVANVVMGQSPESESYNSEGIGLPFHQGVTGFRFRYPENEMWCSAGTRFAEAGDILFSVRAPVGRINVAKERIVIGRGLSAMREKTNRQSWLLYTLKHHFNKEDLIGGGCIFASTTKKELLSVRLLCPKEELVARFEELVRPIDEQISNLNSQTISLATARDALLPRLMKGGVG